jgi:hypothetical protein
MKNPNSTNSGIVKCSWSFVHSASSAMSAFQTIALVYVSATFSRSVNLSDSVKFSRSSYFASVSPCRPARTERWTPQYSHSIDLET